MLALDCMLLFTGGRDGGPLNRDIIQVSTEATKSF